MTTLTTPTAQPENLAKTPIRVFLVDDSPLALVMLQRMLATSPDIEVVGTACNGREALAVFERTKPHVICTDYHMPEMDGLALIQETMAVFPRPILVISSTIDPAERHKAFPLLAAGAVDVFAKPNAATPFEQAAAELVQKIKLLSGVIVITHRRSGVNAVASGAVVTRPTAPPVALDHVLPVLPPCKAGLIRIVAVGASTGGPQVLQTIFSALPANFPCPILCVQHISQGFLSGLVEWLDAQCRLRVKIASNGEVAMPGTIYFPQESTHLEIDSQGRLIYAYTPPVDGHKPSVTVTFDSVARHYGHSALGILLTGMGADGASGLESIMRAGGTTLAQDETSCVVFGMPRQAILRGAAHYVLPPDELTRSLIRLTSTS
ncbi:MAG TPA: chemotaxis-specific protein-glutamate methyltransferase CheB [Abditibacteriaceae bacterium]